jgi:CRP-like cAMP-binding protein
MPLHNEILKLNKLSPEATAFIESKVERKTFKKGTQLLRNGETCNYFYFVNKGILRSYYFQEDKEVTNWFALENDFATSIYSFISRNHAYECIETLEDTELEMLSYASLQEIYAKFPEAERTGRLIIENYYINLEERVISIQFKTAKERYDRLLIRYPGIILRAPMGTIASYLGITQETLSRIRKG